MYLETNFRSWKKVKSATTREVASRMYVHEGLGGSSVRVTVQTLLSQSKPVIFYLSKAEFTVYLEKFYSSKCKIA